jgi:hypothetical protein
LDALDLLLSKIDTLDLDALDLLLSKIDTLDLDALDLLLSKIDTLDLDALDLLLSKIDVVNAEIIKSLIIKLGEIDNDQLEILLAKLNKYGVENTRDIILDIKTYGDLAYTYGMVLNSQVDYWQSIFVKIEEAKKDFAFYTESIEANEETPSIIDGWVEASSNISNIDYVPWDASLNNLRAIGEVKTPTNNIQEVNQNMELDFFINELSYNALFVVSEMEDPVYLKQLIETYKAQGIKIGIVIGQQENVKNIYHSIDAMEYIYSQLAPIADFALLGWRRTSLPHFGEWQTRQDNEGKDVTASDEARAYALVQAHLIRKYNPNLPLIGEHFYFVKGATSYSYNFPWTSASVVLGLGTEFVNTKKIIKNEFPEDICIPLIVGPNYYYNIQPKYSTGLDISKQGIINSRSKIEADVLNLSNIPMTITIVGDMSGERFGNTDSLTKSNWRPSK